MKQTEKIRKILGDGFKLSQNNLRWKYHKEIAFTASLTDAGKELFGHEFEFIITDKDFYIGHGSMGEVSNNKSPNYCKFLIGVGKVAKYLEKNKCTIYRDFATDMEDK
jgi:hypothetical protein